MHPELCSILRSSILSSVWAAAVTGVGGDGASRAVEIGACKGDAGSLPLVRGARDQRQRGLGLGTGGRWQVHSDEPGPRHVALECVELRSGGETLAEFVSQLLV